MKTITKIKKSKKGFMLIELMVATFILVIVMGAMVAVFVSVSNAYQKSVAIKTVAESVQFRLNQIAKDVRMGKIETTDGSCVADGTGKKCIRLARNGGGEVCYRITPNSIDMAENPSGPCMLTEYAPVFGLSGGAIINTSNSLFYSCPTSTPANPITTGLCAGFHRGWVQINLNVVPDGASASVDMTNDTINVQTTVSSRDYGWDEVNP